MPTNKRSEALLRAMESRDYERFRALCQDAKLEAEGFAPVVDAAIGLPDRAYLRLLVTCGANLYAPLFHMPEETLRALLEAGCIDLWCVLLGKERMTPLLALIRQGSLKRFTEALLIGASPDVPCQSGRTPLYEAIIQRRHAHVEKLLAAGAKLQSYRYLVPEQPRPLMRAALALGLFGAYKREDTLAHMRTPKMLKQHMPYGLWVRIAACAHESELVDERTTAFHWAKSSPGMLEALLRNEPFAAKHINTPDTAGETALSTAAAQDNHQAVQALLAHPCADAEWTVDGRTPYERSTTERCKALLQRHGAWIPPDRRTDARFNINVFRRSLGHAGMVFPFGFSAILRGMDIRHADLSRTCVQPEQLAHVPDLTGVLLPPDFSFGPACARGAALRGGYCLPEALPRGVRLIRSTGERIAPRPARDLPGGRALELLDLRTLPGVDWSDLCAYDTFYGVIFPAHFDTHRMRGLKEKRFLYCDFSESIGFYPYFVQEAKEARGLRYPPGVDFSKALFEGVDMSDSDFSLQIPADCSETMGD